MPIVGFNTENLRKMQDDVNKFPTVYLQKEEAKKLYPGYQESIEAFCPLASIPYWDYTNEIPMWATKQHRTVTSDEKEINVIMPRDDGEPRRDEPVDPATPNPIYSTQYPDQEITFLVTKFPIKVTANKDMQFKYFGIESKKNGFLKSAVVGTKFTIKRCGKSQFWFICNLTGEVNIDE